MRRHLLKFRPWLPFPRRPVLLLDFDGTLEPIAPRPGAVRLRPRLGRLLASLARRMKVALISGRSLRDLRRRAAVRGVTLIGNHGAETLRPGGRVRRSYLASDVSTIAALERKLRRGLGGIPGIEFENKGPILAVHMRNVPPRRRGPIARALRRRARRGKMVFELCAPGLPTKFDAVRRLLRPGETAIYFGDDVTDRDAFRALRGGRGISVEVGRRLGADYYVRNPAEVEKALRILSNLRAPR